MEIVKRAKRWKDGGVSGDNGNLSRVDPLSGRMVEREERREDIETSRTVQGKWSLTSRGRVTNDWE